MKKCSDCAIAKAKQKNVVKISDHVKSRVVGKIIVMLIGRRLDTTGLPTKSAQRTAV
jgi:hypothetical protein